MTNRCSSSCPVSDAKIARILKALAELNRCVDERGKHTEVGTRWGVTIGEMDWLSELHDAIYE